MGEKRFSAGYLPNNRDSGAKAKMDVVRVFVGEEMFIGM